METPNGIFKARDMEWDVSQSMELYVAEYEAAVFEVTGRYFRIAHADPLLLA